LHQVVEGTFISEEASSVVRLLIERGADVNKPANGHQTPLHLASHHQHLKPVQVFLDHRANVNAKDWRSRTPLHQVFEDNTLHKDSFSLVQLLVERGTDVNAQDKDHVTPLHMASYRQRPESVRVLLGNGANVNAQESKGQTPLHRVFENPDTSEDVLHVIRRV
jgi:ankyrin repeat protein